MPAPTFVTDVSTAWDDGVSTDSVDVSAQNGDVLVAIAASAEWVSSSYNLLVTSAQVTYTERQSARTTNHCSVTLSSAVGDSTETVTTTSTDDVSIPSGLLVAQWRDSAGVGASNATSRTGSTDGTIALTTTQADSDIVVAIFDWNVTDPTAWTANTTAGTPAVLETINVSSQYTGRIYRYANVGAIGTKTVGATLGSGANGAIVAIEIKGTAGPAVGDGGLRRLLLGVG